MPRPGGPEDIASLPHRVADLVLVNPIEVPSLMILSASFLESTASFRN